MTTLVAKVTVPTDWYAARQIRPTVRLGWNNSYGSGNGVATITSGPEGAWTDNRVKWDNGFFDNLFG